MAVVNLDNLPEPDDGLQGWRFDPDDPPESFTEAHLGRMSLAQVEMCADPEASPLTESQQASFDEVYRRWTLEMKARVRSMLNPVLPKLTTNYNSIIANAMPKVPTGAELLGFDAKALTRVRVPSVLDGQFDSTWKRLISDLNLASGLSPRVRVSSAPPQRDVESSSTADDRVKDETSDVDTEARADEVGGGEAETESGGGGGEVDGAGASVGSGGGDGRRPGEGGETAADAGLDPDNDPGDGDGDGAGDGYGREAGSDAGRVPGTTGDGVRPEAAGHDITLSALVERVERSAEQLAFIGALNDTMQRQAEMSARGSVFYVVVGLATTLGGVATLVGLETGTQRLVAAVTTLVLAGVALAAFFGVRYRQRTVA